MSEYYVLSKTGPKSKFDAQLYGVLLSRKGEILRNPFNKGEEIDPVTYVIEVNEKESKPGVYRDILSVRVQNEETLFVVSDKAHRILARHCDRLDFYEVVIERKEETLLDYKIVNIRDLIECIDHVSSSLIYFESTQETVFNINELVLDEASIPQDLNIFLLGRLRGTVIIIHDRLKKVLEREKLGGFYLCDPIDFVL